MKNHDIESYATQNISHIIKNAKWKIEKFASIEKWKVIWIDICHKRFCDQYTLNVQKWIHTEENSFKCNICDKEFYKSNDVKRKNQRKNHERIHHLMPKLKCTWNGCTAEFNSCQSRMQHIKAIQLHITVMNAIVNTN